MAETFSKCSWDHSGRSMWPFQPLVVNENFYKNDSEHGVFWCIFLKMTDLLWKCFWSKIFQSLVRANGRVWSAKNFTDNRKYIKNQFWVGLEVGRGGPFFCSPLKDIFFRQRLLAAILTRFIFRSKNNSFVLYCSKITYYGLKIIFLKNLGNFTWFRPVFIDQK